MENIVEYLTVKPELTNQIISLKFINKTEYETENKLIKAEADFPKGKKAKIILNAQESLKIKPKLTIEDKKNELKKFETLKSNYPKGQFCSYFIRGVCWLPKENCEFAHGGNDMNYDNLLKLSLNRQKGLVEFSEIAYNIQTYRILINRNYFLLHEFLVENRDKIPGMKHLNYSLEELNRSTRIRFEVRKFLLQKLFDEFTEWVFKKKYESIKEENVEKIIKNEALMDEKEEREKIVKNVFINAEEFDTLVKDAGLRINERSLSKSKILKKSFVDKLTKKKRTIVRLMPKSSDIFDKFVKIILENLKNMKAHELKIALPLNFKLVNQLVIRTIAQEEPFIFNYMNLKNISYSEFMDEVKQSRFFIENLDLIVLDKNEELKSLDPNSELIYKENYFHDENIDEIVVEFRSFLWEKYFNKLEKENYLEKYGFMPYEFIKENFFNFANKKHSFQISDNALNLIIKKILLYDKNLFFINNNFKNFVINFHHFQNLKLSDYFQEGKFDKRCDKQDEKVQKIVQDYFSALSAEKAAEEETDTISDNTSVFSFLEDKIFKWFSFKNTENNNKSNNHLNDLNNLINDNNENDNEISEECKSPKISLDQGLFNKNNDSSCNLKLKNFSKISIPLNYEKEEIIIIDDLTSLLYFVRKSKGFALLAIDLEGRLSSKAADINLIQIYDEASKHIFIIDVYKINYLLGSEKQIIFESLQIIITFIVESDTITKVFHDGRKDIAALHCIFKCCASNYIDTSCIYSFLKQLDLQIEFYKVFYSDKIKLLNANNNNKNIKNTKADLFFDVFFNDTTNDDNSDNANLDINNNTNGLKKASKSTFNNLNYTTNHQISDIDIANMHSLINNSSSPGLNKVLETYEPNGNVNNLKDKMHELMGSLYIKHKLFTERPLDNEFLDYSAKDVKYLISSLRNMQDELKIKINSFYPDIKGIDFELICRILSNDHMKTYCYYESH